MSESRPKKNEILIENKTSPLTLEEKFKNDLWDLDCVSAVVASKKAKKAIKGVPFNCFVLSRGNDDNSDELLNFLKLLKNNIHEIEDKTRFQLAIQSGVHWTCCDVLIQNHNPLIFILDAVYEDSAVKAISESFDKLFPKRKIFLYFSLVADEKEKPKKIQFDESSCSIFTLDHIFHLSNLNIFQEFKNANLKGIKSEPDTFFKITPENCPAALAVIFKGIQSQEVFKNLPTRLHNSPIKFYGIPYTLNNYNLTNLIAVFNKSNKKKMQNHNIKTKRKGFMEDALNFIKAHPEHKDNILSDRIGIKFLSNKAYREQANKPLKEKIMPMKYLCFIIEKILLEIYSTICQLQPDWKRIHAIHSNDYRILTALYNDIELGKWQSAKNVINEEMRLSDLTKNILLMAIENYEKDKPESALTLLDLYRQNITYQQQLVNDFVYPIIKTK